MPRATVNRILKPLKTGDQSSTPLLNSTYRAVEKWSPPQNTDDTGIECKILNASEPESHHSPFFKLLEISTCFYEKKQLAASDISQLTGIDASEVRKILEYWYKKVVISPGIGDQYWMTERDKKIYGTRYSNPFLRSGQKTFPNRRPYVHR